MSKFHLIKIVAFITLLILLAGFVFFRKDEYQPKPKNNQQIEQQPAEDAKNIEKKELTEEDRVKTIAETFASIFYSYTWGNFSNVESLKDKMTQKLWNEKSEWINAEKEKSKGQPMVYIGISNISQKTDIIYIKQNEAKIEIECEQYEVEGNSIYINDILTGIDKFGKESSIYPIYKKIENKKVILKLLKENDEWKVNEIGEK